MEVGADLGGRLLPPDRGIARCGSSDMHEWDVASVPQRGGVGLPLNL